MLVALEGRQYKALEWSLDGVALPAGSLTGVQPGQSVAMHITLPFQGIDIGFGAQGVVAAEPGAPGNATTVIGFRDLGPREQDLLSHFVEQLMRGNMTSIDETIHRLDAPLAASSVAGAQTIPVLSSSVRRWRPARTAAMTAAYGLVGVMAIGYLGSLLYTNIFWLEAPTSAISAPVEKLVSLGDGVVSWAGFKPGDAVKAGDVVLRIADSTLEREIEQAEIGIRDRENKLAYLARRFESEKRRLGTLAGLSSLKSAQASAEVEGLQAKLQAAQRELKQLPSTAAGPLAQVRQRIVSLKQGIAIKGLEMSGRASIARNNDGSHEIIGQSVVGDVDNIAAQIELAEADIAIAARRHQSYLNQRDRLSMRAPFDGVLRQLPHADSATVRKGDVAAVIEQSAERGVTAYLRQDQVARVQIGAEAIVHVPATRQTFRATVQEIDPAQSLNSDRAPQHGTGGSGTARPDNGMAVVKLTLSGTPRAIDLNVYRDGLPAVTMIGLSRVARTQPAGTSTVGEASGGTYRVVSQTSVAEAPKAAPSAAPPPRAGWFRGLAEWARSSRPASAHGD